MSPNPRLEDLRAEWQAACATLIDDCAREVLVQLPGASPLPGLPEDKRLAQVAAAVGQGVRDCAGRRVLPRCLDWLREQGHWAGGEGADALARVELIAALQHAPAFAPRWPQPEPLPLLRSWALAAGCGAAVGMVLLTPLSLLVLGQREVGLFLGGALGAAGLVTLVGALARAPALRGAIQYGLAASGFGALVGGVWTSLRGGSAGWLRASLSLLAVALVVLLARPRAGAAPADLGTELQGPLREHLRHVADLVLAWCWAHPDRQPARPVEPAPAAALPGAVCDTLADLQAQLAAGGAGDDWREAVEGLLQRFEEDGYAWRAVPTGTPFEEAMREDFDTFGLVRPGEPVRTRRAALRHSGRLLRRGELRRA
jgi:hypothetical protein